MKYAIIHLSDIHYRKDEPEGALMVITALIEDLKSQKKKLYDYEFYIAITGDIVFSGDDADSYSEFIKLFNSKLNEIGLDQNHRILVPGNHDIDRSSIELQFKEYSGKINESLTNERDFNNYIRDNNFVDKFENYELFESEFAKKGIDFTLGGKGWNLDNNLGVYCLNTALSSLGGINNIGDENRLAIDTRSLAKWCNTINTKANILLMHHPISYLTEWSELEITNYIKKHFIVCLCGHCHKQKVYYNNITDSAIICSAPQVFTNKTDLLGYGIILIENTALDKIIYREYTNGKFFNSQRFAGNENGIVEINNRDINNIKILELELNKSLAFFKDQSEIFIEPKISKEREFNDNPNLLESIIINPSALIVVAHPQFGLTCLAHYMILESYKINKFWVYLDSNHIKARKVLSEIDSQLNAFGKKTEDIKCIIIDSWDSYIIEHCNILKCIDNEYKGIPIILMSTYAGFNYKSEFNFKNLNSKFERVHLQAFERNKVRKFISKFYQGKNVDKEDIIVKKVVNDLEALNISRTPLNCLTLLKIFENDFNENLINRTKMIKAVLFILFTNSETFTYATNKPDVDDCEYVLGRFCKTLIKKRIRKFSYAELVLTLEEYCKEELIIVEIRTVIDILVSNNILINYENMLEFKHSYWVYYFSATYMLQDEEFKNYIFENRNYVNFPEIIEFYTGIDGRRKDAINILHKDLNMLIERVENKIGIKEEFNPFENIFWNPSDSSIELMRKDILEKVKNSNLPTLIKDQHLDSNYNSEAPYNQTIHNFFNDYSVLSLLQSIRASSLALRNSNYIDPEIKEKMIYSIFSGWEIMAKVLFWLSPGLAHDGNALYDGLYVWLANNNLEDTFQDRIKKIYLSIPINVVNNFKNDLSSMKMGPLFFECLNNNKATLIQKHFIAHFLISEKPMGWQKEMFNFLNSLHRNSYILGDLYDSIRSEIKNGFVPKSELSDLKLLCSIVVAKHEKDSKKVKTGFKGIPKNFMINEVNKLPIDKIYSVNKKS